MFTLLTRSRFGAKKFTVPSLTLLVALTVVGGFTPVYAQGNANSNLEVFGGGVAKGNPQGFNVGQYGNTSNPGSVTVKRDALQQVTWFKSRRQVSIEDDSPVVTRSGGGGGPSMLGGGGGLSQAGFGTNLGGGSMMRGTANLKPANFGPFVKPEQPQARPIMRANSGGLQGKPAVSGAPIVGAPRAAAPASYGNNYGGGAGSGSSSADYEAARVRDVKARLLGK